MHGADKEGGVLVKTQSLAKTSAKGVAAVLDKVLKAEANSASCALLHQPKAPEGLAKFRRK